MSDSLPPPLTPARSDLRDFGFMPLEIVKFRSAALLDEDAEVIVAAWMLYTAAWQEVPAASLKNDDKALARAAGFGRAVSAWVEVKDRALRGWVLCSDGRLYHPVVAKLANTAWKGKVEQRWRTEVARRKKWNERHAEDQLAIPSFETFASHYPDNCPDDAGAMSPRQPELVLATGDENDDDIHSKGESRERDRDRESHISTTDAPPGEAVEPPEDPPEPEDLMGLTERLTRLAGVSTIRPTVIAREMDIVKRWRAAGFDVEGIIVPTIERKVRDMRDDETVSSLAFFDAHILKASNGRKPKPGGSTAKAPPLTERDDDDERIANMRVELRRDLGPKTYDGWLAPGVTAFRLNGTGLVVLARSGFMADWVKTHYEDRLAMLARSHGLGGVRIEGVK